MTWLIEEADQRPVYTVWEDLHWADPSTLDVLSLLLDQAPTTRLLTLLISRPEFSPPWGSRSYLTQLTLNRLSTAHVREMANYVIEQAARASTGSARTGNLSPSYSDSVRPELVEGRSVLPEALLETVVAKTDGVPLFVEELTKSVVESVGTHPSAGSGTVPVPLSIPATLHDSLMARLDRLGSAKEIAQLGATLGREFSYELLYVVAKQDEGRLQQGLRQLVETELIYQRGLPPQATYLFKHALIQDTAYESLLKSRRQQLHQHIAQVLEGQFAETKETQPELLAHHYTEARLAEKAIPYWQQAGQRAAQNSANIEATHHFTKGLALLRLLPDDGQHAQQELAFQVALGGLLMATKDWAAPEVGLIYARARELCKQVNETPQLAPVLWGLTSFYGMKGDVQVATELAEQLMRLAQSTQDPTALILAHRVYGVGLYWRGEFLSALDHFEQVLTFYDRQKQHSRAFLSVLDSAILCQGYRAGTLWCLGYPDQALKKIHEALASAQDMSHPNSLTYARGWATLVHHHRRDVQAVQEQARLLIALCTELQFLFFLPRGRLLHAWAQVEQGTGEEGLTQIRQGLKAEGAMRTGLDRTYYLALAIEVCSKMGQIEEGLQLAAEALELVNDSGRRAFEAEFYRLKGELTLQQLKMKNEELNITEEQDPGINTQSAEACFLKAIDIAQKQQAKSLELRATVSLARLWQQQGKQHAARNTLSDIYHWFTEGFDTKDLQEAKALLEELSR